MDFTIPAHCQEHLCQVRLHDDDNTTRKQTSACKEGPFTQKCSKNALTKEPQDAQIVKHIQGI